MGAQHGPAQPGAHGVTSGARLRWEPEVHLPRSGRVSPAVWHSTKISSAKRNLHTSPLQAGLSGLLNSCSPF